jgi:uncharacterized protein (DUF488 family)
MSLQRKLYTIGHSTHTVAHLASLLHQHEITALGDVRSMPYSRYNPQFNRELLKPFLRGHGIAYVYLGEELGGRSADPACYEQGKLRYDKLVPTPLFQSGLDRVEKGLERYRLALMCAEKEPLNCHRTLLLAPQLEARGLTVIHIHADGTLESHADAMARLAQDKAAGPDLFGAAAPPALALSRLAYPLCTATDPSTPPFLVAAPATPGRESR